MPDAILIIVTVQTVPGLKNLWTCPMTGGAPNAISTPINTTLLTVFIVGRFLGEDAVTATEGRRLPLHPGFYAAHECWGTLDVAARRLEAAERGSTAVGDGDRPPLWCLFNSAHRTALSRQPQDTRQDGETDSRRLGHSEGTYLASGCSHGLPTRSGKMA